MAAAPHVIYKGEGLPRSHSVNVVTHEGGHGDGEVPADGGEDFRADGELQSADPHVTW